MLNKFFITLLSIIVVTFSGHALAGITTIQALSFGNYVVANNNSVQTVTVSLSGNVTASSGLLEITPTAQQGIYDIDGLTPNAIIASVDVTALTTMRGVNVSNEFTLGSFTSNHTNADPSGVARVTIGGTASTTGNGLGYPDQTYSATVEIQINYL